MIANLVHILMQFAVIFEQFKLNQKLKFQYVILGIEIISLNKKQNFFLH